MVELEKIASLLENAHETISSQEDEIASLKAKNIELEQNVELSKEASDSSVSWESSHEMGSAVDGFSTAPASAESNLDSFLSD